MYHLSANDVAVLRELVLRMRTGRINPQQRPFYPENDIQAPEVYAALTPDGGIPSLTVPGLGTGTGSGNEPAFGVCDIYRVLTDGATVDLHPVHAVTRPVYNLSSASIPGDSWILAVRDKFGTWFAVPTATGSGVSYAGFSCTLSAAVPGITNAGSPLTHWLAEVDTGTSFIGQPYYDTANHVFHLAAQHLWQFGMEAVWTGVPGVGMREMRLIYRPGGTGNQYFSDTAYSDNAARFMQTVHWEGVVVGSVTVDENPTAYYFGSGSEVITDVYQPGLNADLTFTRFWGTDLTATLGAPG